MCESERDRERGKGDKRRNRDMQRCHVYTFVPGGQLDIDSLKLVCFVLVSYISTMILKADGKLNLRRKKKRAVTIFCPCPEPP